MSPSWRSASARNHGHLREAKWELASINRYSVYSLYQQSCDDEGFRATEEHRDPDRRKRRSIDKKSVWPKKANDSLSKDSAKFIARGLGLYSHDALTHGDMNKMVALSLYVMTCDFGVLQSQKYSPRMSRATTPTLKKDRAFR